MHERVLRQMREKIRQRQYVMTLHAEEEVSNDELSIFDVEATILTGTIIERQTDLHSGGWKYLVAGNSLAGNEVMGVASLSVTGKLVIITVYREE